MDYRKLTVLLVTGAAAALLSGCGQSEQATGGHGHAHTPKYGGVLVEVGAHEFNLEVLVDPKIGKLTVWTLDAHAENYVRVAAKSLDIVAKVNDGAEQSVVVKAVANPATGEVEGSSAQFEATAEWLRGAKDVEGVVKAVTLGGKDFIGVKFDWPHGAKEDHKH